MADDGGALVTRRERARLMALTGAAAVALLGWTIAVARQQLVAIAATALALLAAGGAAVWVVVSMRRAMWRRLGLEDREAKKRMAAVIGSGELSGDHRIDDAARRSARHQLRTYPGLAKSAGWLVVVAVLLLPGALRQDGWDRWLPILGLAYLTMMLGLLWHVRRRLQRVLVVDGAAATDSTDATDTASSSGSA